MKGRCHETCAMVTLQKTERPSLSELLVGRVIQKAVSLRKEDYICYLRDVAPILQLDGTRKKSNKKSLEPLA